MTPLGDYLGWEPWMERGACRQPGPDGHLDPVWIDDDPDDQAAERARTICRTACPVLADCRRYLDGLSKAQRWRLPGIWAGLTERDRWAKRGPKPAGHATPLPVYSG